MRPYYGNIPTTMLVSSFRIRTSNYGYVSLTGTVNYILRSRENFFHLIHQSSGSEQSVIKSWRYLGEKASISQRQVR